MAGWFVEISAFSMLVVMILAKYGTMRHLVKLQQKKVELENTCNRHEQRYKVYEKERQQFEVQLKSVQRETAIQRSGLEKLLAQLEEQNERNQELEERATG